MGKERPVAGGGTEGLSLLVGAGSCEDLQSSEAMDAMGLGTMNPDFLRRERSVEDQLFQWLVLFIFIHSYSLLDLDLVSLHSGYS